MNIKTVTILGANGAMGSSVGGIFASFGKAKVYMMARDKERAKEAVQRAALSVKAESILPYLIPCDYSMLEKCLSGSDLIFESIVENVDKKQELNKEIAKYAKEDAIICTGSSGLSINQLASSFKDNQKKNYVGLHFFNPPYNMTLCEVIPSQYTDVRLLSQIKEYAKNQLWRTVVQVEDVPAFLGNRIGFYFINKAMQYAEKYKECGGIDYIDAILGQYTGRSMAPLNTANFVGLDIHKAIVDNVYFNTKDYTNESFILPQFVERLILEGKLGRKAGEGFYRKSIENGKTQYQVYDIANENYREVVKYEFPFKERMIDCFKVGNYTEALEILMDDGSIEATICTKFLLNYIVYALFCAKNLSETLSAADDAMATGFGWIPPLALIQALGGVKKTVEAIYKNIPDVANKIDIEGIMGNAPSSTFDYQKYFKAKQ